MYHEVPAGLLLSMSEGTLVRSRTDASTHLAPVRLAPRPVFADCSIVVVTHDSARHIEALLGSLAAAAPGLELHVVVVDNASRDDTVTRVRAAGVDCVALPDNRGYAAGINEGRARVDPRVPLLVLNADLSLRPHSITRLLAATQDPDVGVVVPSLFDGDGRRARSLRREPTLLRALGDSLFGSHWRRRPPWFGEIVWDDAEYDHCQDVDWATGAALLVSAECDDRVGAWDERYFLYSEEVDYCARVRDADLRVRYVPDAGIDHAEGGSGRSPALTALLAVNRVQYYASRHGARAARAFRWVVILHELLRVGEQGHRRAVVDLFAPASP
jgi:GT2 family glycosyltransferase